MSRSDRHYPAAGAPVPGNKNDMTIAQWCVRRGLSLTTFYNLRKKGLAPEVVGRPGSGGQRITQKADRDWERKMLRLSKQAAARREAERRSQIRAAAGRIAAASPLHHCRRKRRQG